MAILSGMSYYPAGLFSKKSKLASKSGSNKGGSVNQRATVLTAVYCNRLSLLPRLPDIQQRQMPDWGFSDARNEFEIPDF